MKVNPVSNYQKIKKRGVHTPTLDKFSNHLDKSEGTLRPFFTVGSRKKLFLFRKIYKQIFRGRLFDVVSAGTLKFFLFFNFSLC